MKDGILTLAGPAFRTWAPAIGARRPEAGLGKETNESGQADGRASDRSLARGFYPRTSAAAMLPWAKPGAPTAVADKDAFWELLSPCRDRLFNYIRKSLRFATAAEDVYQETVLNAFRHFETFRPDKEFAPWIFAIAHNALRDHFRREARTPAGPAVERLGEEDGSRTRELVQEIFAYAERLKPRHREVFFLFYDSGFSVAEIAGVTGLREGNIKLILHQARNSLKAALGVTP